MIPVIALYEIVLKESSAIWTLNLISMETPEREMDSLRLLGVTNSTF